MFTNKERRIIDLLPDQNLIEKIAGEGIYKSTNLLMAWDRVQSGDFLTAEDSEVSNFISFMRSFGFVPFSEFIILNALVFLVSRDRLIIPYEGEYLQADESDVPSSKVQRKVRKDRKIFFDSIIMSLTFKLSDGKIIILEKKPGTEDSVDITSEIFAKTKSRLSSIRYFVGHAYMMKYTTKYFRDFVSNHKGLLVFLANSNPDFKSPTIVVNEGNLSVSNVTKMADVSATSSDNIYNHALGAIIEYSNLRTLQKTELSSVSCWCDF